MNAGIALKERALIEISGADAEHFLDNLITCQVAGLDADDARFGALLTPQGKILFDFFLLKTADGFLIEVAADLAPELEKRLTFYRLRAKVEIIAKLDLQVAVASSETLGGSLHAFSDPRHSALGFRHYGQFDELSSDEGPYHELRIQNCVAEGGIDYAYSDAYPHETLMDQFAGVDFKKGCYVGQEVISRMQHRGTTKKRVMLVEGSAELPPTGTPVSADGKPAGMLGTVSGKRGLAVLRLDRVQSADLLEAESVGLSASLPDWVNFTWPERPQ